MHWGRIHRVKDLPWLVRGQLFDGLGILFSLGFFTILCASEDSRSFMGGSDVVHCVRFSLIGTIVAPFWAHWSLVGDWFVQLHSLCDIIRGNGAPLMLFVMGPRPGNVARAI